MGNRVKFLQDKTRLKDWYVMKCEKDSDGFLIKNYVRVGSVDHFFLYNRILISQIFSSLNLEGNIIKFRLGGVEKININSKEMLIYPLITVKIPKNISKNGIKPTI